ncbi:ABC-2 type transport system permease protein [Natronoarchaeum philippinense]|uniref:ABC-2 type transport system permease protein n=1 Tax=Natronoarchaeum philippinense TaxID=558529 RepID=A0A285NVK4_NATPI|nr:ABC transporter permease subunit [Natronoarchaeum philippinense]SNZ13495.1 ABC-2 type transport system permease protein [Natronoarchaeum philippinense]
MSWQLVARKDFEDTIRSKMIWSIVGVFVLLMGIVGVGTTAGGSGDPSAVDVIGLFVSLAGNLLIPVTALVVGYMAVVGERQSGSLRVLFGLGHNRKDVVAGKYVSRVAVMVLVSLVTLAVAGVMILGLVGSVPVETFGPFLVLTVLLAMAFTALAVGISSMTDTRMQAMGGAIGSYVGFSLLWHPFVAGVHYLVEGELAGLDAPSWYFLLLRLDPMTAYRQSISMLTEQYQWPLIGWTNIVEDIPQEQLAQESLLVSNRVAGELPFYLTEWFGAVILLAWVVVPAAVGYWRFERADLN